MPSQPEADAPLAQKNKYKLVAIATRRVKSFLLIPTFYKVLGEESFKRFINLQKNPKKLDDNEKLRGDQLAAANLAKAEERHSELLARRQRRREELARQRALTLQNVERISSILILPHPDSSQPEIKNLKPNKAVEELAMQVAMEFEQRAGRVVTDVHDQDLGYDLTSLDTRSGELRLIEVKGLSAPEGTILLTPNEHRVAEDRRDCYWLYVIVDCASGNPKLITEKDPASKEWHEVKKVAHYTLSVKSIGGAMTMSEPKQPYGGNVN